MILFWPLFFGAGFFAGAGVAIWILSEPTPSKRPNPLDEAEEIAEREFQANGS